MVEKKGKLDQEDLKLFSEVPIKILDYRTCCAAVFDAFLFSEDTTLS